jgi:hypothetical protein
MAVSDLQKVRVLIGDNDPTDQDFSDDEIQTFLDTMSGSVFMACAVACDTAASRIGRHLQEVKIGTFTDYSGRHQAAVLRTQADAWRQLEYDTPAFAVIEENTCGFNELVIIRNWVLRTEL